MSRKTYTKKWPKKTLAELVSFLEERHPEGLALKTVSEEIGVTPQALSSMFCKDDARLSRIEQIAETYGYTLRLFFPLKTFPVEGIVVPPPKRTYANAGNLAGLVRYINDSNYSIKYVSELVPVYPSMLTRAFETGDIMVSKLYRVADALNICFIWKFIKNKTD